MAALFSMLLSCNSTEKKVETNETPSCCANHSNASLPSAIATNADSLLEKEVEVSGYVLKVCKCSGRKAVIADSANAETTLTALAIDSTIKFTPDLVGKTIIVKGVLKENKITKEAIEEKGKAMAEAAQAEGEKSCCKAKEEKQEESKSCCKKEDKQSEKKHCGGKGMDFSAMKVWMEENGKDYYPIYFVEAAQYTVKE